MNAPDFAPPLDDEPTRLRVPPHSQEAEQSVLGALLLDSTAFAQVSDLLTEADFFAQAHRRVFSSIQALIAEGRPVDLVTVYEHLQALGKADDVGGLVYINALSQATPSAANIRRHAEIVVERATRRALISAADEMATAAFSPQGRPVAEILDDVKVRLGQLADGRSTSSKRIPILSLSQLREQAHEVDWLVKHVIPANCIGMLFGASGTFKSFIAVDFACHVAHGLKWLGQRTEQRTVLYVAAEGGTGLWGRICAWHQARKLKYEDAPLHIVPVAVDIRADAWRVVETAQTMGITPGLVVIDTLSQTFSGEENSASEVAAYFREIGTRFRQLWGCTVLVLHHTGHSATERPRGSSAMLANLDFMAGVFRDENQMLATMTCAKQKDGEPFKDVNFSVSKHFLGTDKHGDKVSSLVARHLSSVEDVQEAMQAEGSAGRKGHNSLLLSLIQNGQKLSELRTVFYGECGLDSADSRRKAFNRAKDWLVETGLIEVVGDVVITLKGGT